MKTVNTKPMERYFRSNFSREDDFGYSEDMTTKELCAIAVREYRKQGVDHPFNMKKFPNDIYRLADWLRGLPEPFNPTPYADEIEELLIEWGIVKDESYAEQVPDISDLWYAQWADWMIKIVQVKKDQN